MKWIVAALIAWACLCFFVWSLAASSKMRDAAETDSEKKEL